MSRFLAGLIQLRIVNYSEFALSLNREIETDSNYKCIQRFFRAYTFPFDCLSKFVWYLLDQPGFKVVLSFDRTNWKFGKKNINILMIRYCYSSMANPLMWKILENKRGNSSQVERIELMEKFLNYFSLDFAVKLVADREFIGKNFLE